MFDTGFAHSVASHATGPIQWLATYALHSAVLLGAAWCLCRWTALSPRLRETVWKAALVGGVATASLQLGLGVTPLAGRLAVFSLAAADGIAVLAPAPATDADDGKPDAVAATSTLAAVAATPVGTGPRLGENPTDAARAPQPHRMGDAAGAGRGFAGARANRDRKRRAAGAAPAPRPRSEQPSGWVAALACAWLLGVLLGLAGLARSSRRLRRQLADRCPLDSGPLADMLADLRRRAGMARSVRLSVSEQIPVPIAIGLQRGEICVPRRTLLHLKPDCQTALLAHELAHVVRRDPLWRLIAKLIEAIFFFQPLNRVAAREMDVAAELLGDEWAAAITERPIALATCLAEVATWLTSPLPGAVSPMAAPGAGLRRRVERLVSAPSAPRPLPRWTPLALASGLGLFVAIGPGAAVGQSAAAPSPDRSAAAPADPAQAGDRGDAAGKKDDFAAAENDPPEVDPTANHKAAPPRKKDSDGAARLRRSAPGAAKPPQSTPGERQPQDDAVDAQDSAIEAEDSAIEAALREAIRELVALTGAEIRREVARELAGLRARKAEVGAELRKQLDHARAEIRDAQREIRDAKGEALRRLREAQRAMRERRRAMHREMRELYRDKSEVQREMRELERRLGESEQEPEGEEMRQRLREMRERLQELEQRRQARERERERASDATQLIIHLPEWLDRAIPGEEEIERIVSTALDTALRTVAEDEQLEALLDQVLGVAGIHVDRDSAREAKRAALRQLRAEIRRHRDQRRRAPAANDASRADPASPDARVSP